MEGKRANIIPPSKDVMLDCINTGLFPLLGGFTDKGSKRMCVILCVITYSQRCIWRHGWISRAVTPESKVPFWCLLDSCLPHETVHDRHPVSHVCASLGQVASLPSKHSWCCHMPQGIRALWRWALIELSVSQRPIFLFFFFCFFLARVAFFFLFGRHLYRLS